MEYNIIDVENSGEFLPKQKIPQAILDKSHYENIDPKVWDEIFKERLKEDGKGSDEG